MKRRVLAATISVATLISLPALGLPAHAQPPMPGPLTELTLSISNAPSEPAGPGEVMPAPIERSVTLTCDPTGGTHPKAAQACADLKKAGDFAHLPILSTPRACYMIFAPVSAMAIGHLGATVVRFQATYSNDCFLAAQTGSIFAF